MLQTAKIDNVDCIVKLLKDAAQDGHFLDLDSVNQRPGLLRELCSKGISKGKRPTSSGGELACRYWIWTNQDSIHGYAMFSVIDSMMTRLGFPKSCIELHQLVIDPARRRKGIGREFLSALLEQYADKDIFVRCLPASKGFVKLATSVGFKNLGIARSNGETLLYLGRDGAAERVRKELYEIGMLMA